MTEVVAAIAIASGHRGALVTAIVLASPHVVPAWITMAALIAWSRHRPTHEDAEVAFFSSAAAHLSAGLPLREALVRAGDPAHLGLEGFRRRLAAGVPLDECAADAAKALPGHGAAFGHALAVSARSGGRMGPLMDRFAERAAASLDLQREARTASAAARASVALLGGVPIALSLHRLTTDAPGGEQVLVVAGTVLIALGTAFGWALARGIRP